MLFAEKEDVQQLIDNPKVALVLAPGSCQIGNAIGQRVAARLGRCLLELGGNNGLIVCKSANLTLALRAIVFSALGTCGQRCTSLRRLFVDQCLIETLLPQLIEVYQSVEIGDPFNEPYLMGPVINQAAIDNMLSCIELAIK